MLATSLTCRFPALFSAPVPVLARSPHSVSVPTAAASLLWRRPRPSHIVPLRFPPRRDHLLCHCHARLRCRARLVQNSPRHSTLSVPCRRLRISMPRPHGSRRPQHVRTHSHYPRTRGFAVCPHVLLCATPRVPLTWLHQRHIFVSCPHPPRRRAHTSMTTLWCTERRRAWA
ncbi:hypothetical protein B0H14DRAFT_1577985 [Mycena olivaceomarginata]|nr:hypothetical protein B0H14DRAFT_1577985 [Mycena olivaceomarginata]